MNDWGNVIVIAKAALYLFAFTLIGMIGLIAFGDLGLPEPMFGFGCLLSALAFAGYVFQGKRSRLFISAWSAIGASAFLLLLSLKPEPEGRDQASAVEVLENGAESSPEAVATAERASPVSTDVDDILDTYAENQIAGREKFERHGVNIRGRVTRVREALGTGIVVLSSPHSNRDLEISFSDRDTKKLSVLKHGDNIVATCPEVSEGMGNVFVSECSDVEIIRH